MLFLSTMAFTVCFAVWMLNGVLVTYLAENRIFDWGPIEIGWLMGIPVLSGSLLRLPAGILTDKYGGKWIFILIMFISAIFLFSLSYMKSFSGFMIMSLGLGISGASFAVGISYVSAWYPINWQGRVLGIFGMGNAGAAITSLIVPSLLGYYTLQGLQPSNWVMIPRIFAAGLILMAIVFMIFGKNIKLKKSNLSVSGFKGLINNQRVWRFSLYYFLVFGCFVAFSQWLVPYFVNAYSTSLVYAGILASIFSFPSGVIRALGGWMSDKWGAKKVMSWVLNSSLIASLVLSVPPMIITSPSAGVMSSFGGRVEEVSDSLIKVNNLSYPLIVRTHLAENKNENLNTRHYLPTAERWQTPVVTKGQKVLKRQLLASGNTQIIFRAEILIFILMILALSISWGIGKAAVYKYIAQYFPGDVGTIGGFIGVIGGLGGFLCPILFGYLLNTFYLWTTSWIFIFILSAVCIWWRNRALKKLSTVE